MNDRIEHNADTQKGSITLLMALVMVIAIGVAALVIDLGSAFETKAELQNSADAAVLAGNRELANIYRENASTAAIQTYNLTATDRARILDKVQAVAGMNRAGGRLLSILPSDVALGKYDTAADAVVPTNVSPRAVSLKTRRDDTANDAMPAALAGVVGIDSIEIRANAAAGISPLGHQGPGSGTIPVAIDASWFDSSACGPGSEIKFFPTGDLDGCAAWHTYDDYPSSSNRLGTILEGMQNETYTSPATTAGETEFSFIGGAVASQFDEMKRLYDLRKDDAGNWSVVIPVYEASNCSNPSGMKLIVGFATARIYNVATAPAQTISANVDCGIVDEGYGGGTNDYGTLMGRPGLLL